MSLATAGPLARRQLSSFPASLNHESTNQQVPGSPLSPAFFAAHLTGPTARSPSSGSPLAQVPDGGSPLLRQLLACRKRQRDDSTPSPSPASKRSTRDSPRVPNSIIVVKRTAPPSNKGEQVVPTTPTPQLERNGDFLGLRKLPEVMNNTKLLDLFGGTKEIFASCHEE